MHHDLHIRAGGNFTNRRPLFDHLGLDAVRRGRFSLWLGGLAGRVKVRITGGQFRRRALRSADADTLRPTARRLRETLFEFLGRRIAGARWLDLCAGSGAVGIEALSRGASFATFVEREPETCALIEANLTSCGARQQAEVWRSEAASFLRQAGATETWDI